MKIKRVIHGFDVITTMLRPWMADWKKSWRRNRPNVKDREGVAVQWMDQSSLLFVVVGGVYVVSCRCQYRWLECRLVVRDGNKPNGCRG